MTHGPPSDARLPQPQPGQYRPPAGQSLAGLDDPPIEPAPPGGRARFARFVSHEYGIRALALLLTTYQDRHGLRTIRGIVTRWAPGAENDTEAYIAAVARRMDRHPRAELDLHRHEDLRPLVEAIIVHELGGNPYDRRDHRRRVAPRRRRGQRGVRRWRAAARPARPPAPRRPASAASRQPRRLPQVAPHLGGAADLARALGPWVAAALILAAAAWFIWQRSRRAA